MVLGYFTVRLTVRGGGVVTVPSLTVKYPFLRLPLVTIGLVRFPNCHDS